MTDAAEHDPAASTFLQLLREHLALANASLVKTRNPDAVAIEEHWFVVPEAIMPARLLLQRTSRSHGLPMPEYRACVVVMLPPEVQTAVARRRHDANRQAALGAVSIDGLAVRCQAIIDPAAIPILSAAVAHALLHSGLSLSMCLHWTRRPTLREILRGQFRRPEQPKVPSLWSEADLQRLHFDRAHLGGSLHRGVWRHETGSADLSLALVDDHPHFGGGLLLRLHMPRQAFALGRRRVSAEELNSLAYGMSDAPTFGSWAEDRDGYSFLSFVPNGMYGLLGIMEQWVAWGIRCGQNAEALAQQYLQRAVTTPTQRAS